MHPQPTPAPHPETPPDPAPTDAAYYRRVLHELIDIGLNIVRTLDPKAAAPAQPDPAAFDRVVRAVRRTIILARHLNDPAPAPPATARKRIIRAVEDAIHDTPRKPADKERLETELHERLDRPEIDEDIAHRPVTEIIDEICRDLGVAGPPGLRLWPRRTLADIARLCARAARAPIPRPATAPEAADDPERFFRLVAAPIPA